MRYPQAVVPEFLLQVRRSYQMLVIATKWGCIADLPMRLQYRLVSPATSEPITTAANRIASVDLTKATADVASESFRELAVARSPLSSAVSAFPLSLRDDPIDNVFSESTASTLPPRQQEQTKRGLKYNGALSADVVLANCARQKTQLREDLDALHSLFWVGARDAWARALQDQACPELDGKANASASRATLFADMLPADVARGGGADRRDPL